MNSKMKWHKFWGTLISLGKEQQTPTTEGFDCACWFSCIYIIPPADVAVDIRDGNCRLEGSTLHRHSALLCILAARHRTQLVVQA